MHFGGVKNKNLAPHFYFQKALTAWLRGFARFFEGKQQIISKKGGDRKNMREGTIEVQMSPCICRKNMGQYYI